MMLSNNNRAIMFLVNDKLGAWLQQEREKLGLTQAELARISGLNRAIISKIENNLSDPTPETLSAIAHALRLPPETVFRVAGLLPPKPPGSEKLDEALHILSMLEQDDLDEIIQIARLKLGRQASSSIKKSRIKPPAQTVLNGSRTGVLYCYNICILSESKNARQGIKTEKSTYSKYRGYTMNNVMNQALKSKKTTILIIISIVFAVIIACCLFGIILNKYFPAASTSTAIVQTSVEPNTSVEANTGAVPAFVQSEKPTSLPLPTDTPIPLPTDTSLPAPTETPNVSIGALGERIERSGIALTVLSASKTTDISFFQADTGKTFLAIEVLIENVSRDDETPYNVLYFSVKDESGYEYQTTFASPEPSLTSGKLVKGDKVRGFVAFEVPNTSTQYIVTYEPLVILGGYEPIRINT